MKKLLSLAILLVGCVLFAENSVNVEKTDCVWNVSGKNYKLVLSEDGKLKSIKSGRKIVPIIDHILVGFNLDAPENPTITSNDSKFKGSRFENGKLIFDYTHAVADYSIILVPSEKSFDFTVDVKCKSGAIKYVHLPHKIVINPDDISGISGVTGWWKNLGITVNGKFFKPRGEELAGVSYTDGIINNGEVFKSITGKSIPTLPKAKAKLSAGQNANEWLGNKTNEILKSLENGFVSRPSVDADINIISSDKGGILSGYTLGGKGALFRVGGTVESPRSNHIVGVIEATLYKKAFEKRSDKKRNKICVICPVFNDQYPFKEINAIRDAHWDARENLVYITTSAELAKALNSPETLMIVNTKPEYFLQPAGMSESDFAEAVKQFVIGGGYWFERGGYPFYRSMVDKPFLEFYTGAVGDYTHFNLDKIRFSLYSIQPVADRDFTKGTPYCNGSNQLRGTPNGAEMKRYFGYYIQTGKSLTLPMSRVKFGEKLMEGARSFCADNKIQKKLSDKVSEDFFKKFKSSPIIRTWHENIKDVENIVEEVPTPSIVHIPLYSLYGYDKGYPDLLPPAKSYATPERFRKLIDRIHARGCMFMPYTNNTWIPMKDAKGNDVTGHTFKKYGESMLSKSAKGNFYREQYSQWGYTVCMWDKRNLEETSKFIKGFVEDYPADIVFQDQTGSRVGLRTDFNPASPTVNSYLDGILNSTKIDSQKVHLATEDGWAHLADYEIMFTGLTWGFLSRNVNTCFLWEVYPKDSFKLNNLVGAQLHDKLSITQHNLTGHIESDRVVSASILYGLHIIHDWVHWRHHSKELMRWAGALQRDIASKYTGEELKRFKTEWVNKTSADGYYTGKAKYGDLSVVANLNDKPLQEDNITIAPFGFFAKSKNSMGGYIVAIGREKVAEPTRFTFSRNGDKGTVCLYVKANSQVIVPIENVKSLKFQGSDIPFENIAGGIKFTSPLSESEEKLVFFEVEVQCNN